MKRILIIEDDIVWAALLARYCGQLGYAAQVVSSAEAAIDEIDAWQPDGLVVDMLLAGQTGMALLYELRSHEDLACIPVVVCSSVGVELDALRACGVRAVLHKVTMTPAQARCALQEVFDGAE